MSEKNVEQPQQLELLPLPLPLAGEGRGEGLPLPLTPPPPGGRQGWGQPTRHSPFAGHIPADRPTSAGQTGVRLTVSTLHSVIQLSTWPTGVLAWEAALSSALGEPVPQKTGDTRPTKLGLAMRTGPEELMLVSDDATQPASREMVAKLREQVRADIGSVLDLSHARCRIGIEGEHCVDTLAKLFALDFRDGAFPIDKVHLSSHRHMPCTLLRTGAATFDAYVFTTYAREQLESFADAALEFGVAVTGG